MGIEVTKARWVAKPIVAKPNVDCTRKKKVYHQYSKHLQLKRQLKWTKNVSKGRVSGTQQKSGILVAAAGWGDQDVRKDDNDAFWLPLTIQFIRHIDYLL